MRIRPLQSGNATLAQAGLLHAGLDRNIRLRRHDPEIGDGGHGPNCNHGFEADRVIARVDVATLDADVLVVVPDPARIDLPGPIYRYCQSLGYLPEVEAVLVGKWPVQFVPVFSELTTAAVHAAETDEIDDVPVRVVSAAYLAVIALSVGRAKDHLRIVSLLESAAVVEDTIQALAQTHGLGDKWQTFRRKYLDE